MRISNEAKLISLLLKKKLLQHNKANDYLNLNIKTLSWKEIKSAVDKNPRLLEPCIVLMAKFPRSIIDYSLVPEDLKKTIDCLRIGKEKGLNYKFARYRKLFFLCNIISDGRVKNLEEIKVRKNYRLHKKCIETLKSIQIELDLNTETDVIEFLINGYLSKKSI